MLLCEFAFEGSVLGVEPCLLFGSKILWVDDSMDLGEWTADFNLRLYSNFIFSDFNPLGVLTFWLCYPIFKAFGIYLSSFPSVSTIGSVIIIFDGLFSPCIP